MLGFIEKYAKNYKYSQFGEEGILEEICSRLKITGGTCAEFGAHNGLYLSNTRWLLEQGWSGRLIENDRGFFNELKVNSANVVANVRCEMVTHENVNKVIPKKLDLLSIDIDGNDYATWKAYTGKSKIVIIEINSSIPPDKTEPISDSKHGTGYSPMVELGLKKGYFLLGHTGNLIFIEKKYKNLFPEIIADPLTEAELFFNTSWLIK